MLTPHARLLVVTLLVLAAAGCTSEPEPPRATSAEALGAAVGEAVVVIHPFEDAGSYEEPWQVLSGALQARDGFEGAQLHEALGDAAFRFITVARWAGASDQEAFEASALGAEARQLYPEAPSTALYRAVEEQGVVSADGAAVMWMVFVDVPEAQRGRALAALGGLAQTAETLEGGMSYTLYEGVGAEAAFDYVAYTTWADREALARAQATAAFGTAAALPGAQGIYRVLRRTQTGEALYD